MSHCALPSFTRAELGWDRERGEVYALGFLDLISRAMANEDEFPAPEQLHDLPFGDRSEVEIDRRAGGDRRSVRIIWLTKGQMASAAPTAPTAPVAMKRKSRRVCSGPVETAVFVATCLSLEPAPGGITAGRPSIGLAIPADMEATRRARNATGRRRAAVVSHVRKRLSIVRNASSRRRPLPFSARERRVTGEEADRRPASAHPCSCNHPRPGAPVSLRLALFQPDIPQNTGTILRLAACMGVAVDIIEPAAFPVSDRAFRRAGMDYLDRVSIQRHVSWSTFEQDRKQAGRRLVLASTKGATPYAQFDSRAATPSCWVANWRASPAKFIRRRMRALSSP